MQVWCLRRQRRSRGSRPAQQPEVGWAVGTAVRHLNSQEGRGVGCRGGELPGGGCSEAGGGQPVQALSSHTPCTPLAGVVTVRVLSARGGPGPGGLVAVSSAHTHPHRERLPPI